MTRPASSRDDDAFFDEAPCGFITATPDGVIRRVNRTVTTMSGFSAADLVGHRTFASLLSVSGQIYVETHLSPLLLNDGTVRAVALELVHADGHRIPVLVSATLARIADEPVALRIAVLDATERRAYEQELLAARLRAEEFEARARTLVRTLQQTLIPPITPAIEGLELEAVYRPAGSGDEVGGDFYDVFQIGIDDWIIAVGDVEGTGMHAATMTALARYTIPPLPSPPHTRQPSCARSTTCYVTMMPRHAGAPSSPCGSLETSPDGQRPPATQVIPGLHADAARSLSWANLERSSARSKSHCCARARASSSTVTTSCCTPTASPTLDQPMDSSVKPVSTRPCGGTEAPRTVSLRLVGRGHHLPSRCHGRRHRHRRRPHSVGGRSDSAGRGQRGRHRRCRRTRRTRGPPKRN